MLPLAILTLVFIVVLTPISAAAPLLIGSASGLSAREATGSIWSGAMADVRLGSLSLGDLRYRLSPLHLPAGQVRLNVNALESADQPSAFRAALLSGITGVGVADLSGDLIPRDLLFEGGVSGLAFTDFSARFSGGHCVAASGRVVARLSAAMIGVPGLTLPATMDGTARCDKDALLLPLKAASGDEALMLRIMGDGRYRAELTVVPGDPAVGATLTMAGFVPVSGGFRFAFEGRL